MPVTTSAIMQQCDAAAARFDRAWHSCYAMLCYAQLLVVRVQPGVAALLEMSVRLQRPVGLRDREQRLAGPLQHPRGALALGVVLERLDDRMLARLETIEGVGEVEGMLRV